ncbi:hypothetical protein DXT76_10770 [Halobacillus trueperi]|uniref:Pycsar effector protein domain-containing protein n=1 Tax=Halobacillus trueperi TaxID=156205 RepID=A0A3D8VN40_9BACI|nr:Pycsar system effector family protein [Halobacillus trueperi]RDY70859.1 hypothetical protein DXT76_10770 [Halobacillus trueperi]
MDERRSGEESAFDKEEISKTLDRVNYWISNCDTKISFALAFAGVLLAVFFTSNVINDSLEGLLDLLKTYDTKTAIAFTNVTLLVGFFICLVTALVFFMLGLKGSVNSYNYKQEGLTTNSLLFFGTIKSTEFKRYKEAVESSSPLELRNDYLSQIHINSTICQRKFERYNNGVLFLIAAIVLFVLLNIMLLFI